MAEGGTIQKRVPNDFVDSKYECNLPCSSCIQMNVQSEADRYCSDCLDFFCTNCIRKTHGVGSALARHDLVAIGNMPPAPTKKCNEHETMIIDMYCETHNEIGCTKCFILHHSL